MTTLSVLHRHYVRPSTVDRILSSWIAPAIEQYVEWLTEREYAVANVFSRVPILVKFGEFSRSRGARKLKDLPSHAQPFFDHCVTERAKRRPLKADRRRQIRQEVRTAVEQMLRVSVPGFVGDGRRRKALPFVTRAPGFFEYLREERGLRPGSIRQYIHHLGALETYLLRVGLKRLRALSPLLLSGFLVEESARRTKRSTTQVRSDLRVFLRYLHREMITPKDLSRTIDRPGTYRYSTVPRSATWEEVHRMLEAVDRRTPVGRWDYAILLLLVAYGLRAREVAALTLDDLDWRAERLRVPQRKAGHSSAYPLSALVGEAILDYLKNGRPKTTDRHVFFSARAPRRPITYCVVSKRAGSYLRKIGAVVPRPGSHTLRHGCVQRLVDAQFPLKTIGDYVGHRQPSSTQIYGKVQFEELREVASGDGEAIL